MRRTKSTKTISGLRAIDHAVRVLSYSQTDGRMTKNSCNKSKMNFRAYLAHVHQRVRLIKLRIVGILPDGPDYATAGFSASSAISMLTSSTLGYRGLAWYDVVSTRSALQDIFDPPVFNYGIDTAIYFAEYDSPDVARTILKTKDCAVSRRYAGPLS